MYLLTPVSLLYLLSRFLHLPNFFYSSCGYSTELYPLTRNRDDKSDIETRSDIKHYSNHAGCWGNTCDSRSCRQPASYLNLIRIPIQVSRASPGARDDGDIVNALTRAAQRRLFSLKHPHTVFTQIPADNSDYGSSRHQGRIQV